MVSVVCLYEVAADGKVGQCFSTSFVVWQEQQQKEEAAEVKKRPRKKTKPPALTRPPRKGKKKKGKNVRPQKPMPPDKPTGDIGKFFFFSSIASF